MEKKTKKISLFAPSMILGIVACTALDVYFNGSDLRDAMVITAIAAAICGVVNCVLSSEGSIWNWLFGLPAVACQGVVALNEGNVGVGWMDLALLVPMQIIGFCIWMRHGASLSVDSEKSQVKARRLSWPYRLGIMALVTLSLCVLSVVLEKMDTNAPWIDAACVILQIIAQILMTLAFMEQWVLWIVVNAAYLALWVVTLVQTGSSNAVIMIAMWAFYLVISIRGFVVWKKISE